MGPDVSRETGNVFLSHNHLFFRPDIPFRKTNGVFIEKNCDKDPENIYYGCCFH